MRGAKLIRDISARYPVMDYFKRNLIITDTAHNSRKATVAAAKSAFDWSLAHVYEAVFDRRE